MTENKPKTKYSNGETRSLGTNKPTRPKPPGSNRT